MTQHLTLRPLGSCVGVGARLERVTESVVVQQATERLCSLVIPKVKNKNEEGAAGIRQGPYRKAMQVSPNKVNRQGRIR